MTLRADHVAGAAFILFGIAILALSGELPFGNLAMPGSGFLPLIVAVLTMFFGLLLVLRSGESPAFADLDWTEIRHALVVTLITAAATALYTVLGFVITMAVMMIALLLIIERQNPVRAIAYSVAIVLLTYASFTYLLKTPLPYSPFYS